jgi:thiosulfate/3-mercaptopyruvate sulfurtransferase
MVHPEINSTSPFNSGLLLRPHELNQWQHDRAKELMVFDCSFNLSQSDAGLSAFQELHIPGAHYVHLDSVLSSQDPDRRASGGRHPLPWREDFAHWLGSVGFGTRMQAVVYDRNGGMFCGRMWWMLKWLGHSKVAILDGGLNAWLKEGYPTESGLPSHSLAPSTFQLSDPLVELLDAQSVEALLERAQPTEYCILDARAAARYRGEVEPLDPVAGHIPGAYNRPFNENFDEQGRYKDAQTLSKELRALLPQHPPQTMVHHCGSGVSAIPNLVAMEIAGFKPGALYAGSWSDWVSERGRPVRGGSER